MTRFIIVGALFVFWELYAIISEKVPGESRTKIDIICLVGISVIFVGLLCSPGGIIQCIEMNF